MKVSQLHYEKDKINEKIRKVEETQQEDRLDEVKAIMEKGFEKCKKSVTLTSLKKCKNDEK